MCYLFQFETLYEIRKQMKTCVRIHQTLLVVNKKPSSACMLSLCEMDEAQYQNKLNM